MCVTHYFRSVHRLDNNKNVKKWLGKCDWQRMKKKNVFVEKLLTTEFSWEYTFKGHYCFFFQQNNGRKHNINIYCKCRWHSSSARQHSTIEQVCNFWKNPNFSESWIHLKHSLLQFSLEILFSIYSTTSYIILAQHFPSNLNGNGHNSKMNIIVSVYFAFSLIKTLF